MVITVVGVGFVGLVSAAVFAKFGNKVYALNRDQKKCDQLKQGKMPFYEPGLEELVKQGLKEKNLIFTTNYATAIASSEVIFIAVGTPSAPDGQADITQVLAAAESLAPHLKSGAIVIIKSTVPPSTNSKVNEVIKAKTKKEFFVVASPEFLREGNAVDDCLHPDRILLGTTNQTVAKTLEKLHQPLTKNIIILRPESAQMAKYSANTYLAQRITFVNQMADLCEKNGADIQEVILAMGSDKRIGSHYWYPGLGYGGSCFPKDVREIAAYSRAVGEGGNLFVKIDELNESRIPKLLESWDKKINGFKSKTVAVFGTAFKPNTSDTREAPAKKITSILVSWGATIKTCDPQAPADFIDPYDCAQDADVVLLLIEWDEFKNLDLKKLKAKMTGNIFIDTRNQYLPLAVTAAGFKYIGVGR